MVHFECFMRMFTVENSGCSPEQPMIINSVLFLTLSTIVSLMTLSMAQLKCAFGTVYDDDSGYLHP